MNKSIIIEKIEYHSEQNWYKKNVVNLIYSVLVALFVIFVCTFSNRKFFFYDDFQNQIMPYWKNMGKFWLKGEVPFLANTMIGKNNILEIDRAMFLPQNIFMSVLASKISSFNLIAKINAFINLALMCFFSQKLSEALNLNGMFKRVLALLFCINPIFIYIFLPAWVVLASGQVWFVAMLASVLFLRKSFKYKYICFYIISSIFIYLNAFPNYIICYFAIIFIYLMELLLNKEYKKSLLFCLVSLGIFLIGISIFSEFILSSKMLTRNITLGNFNNFGTPTLNQILINFNPVYFNFLSWYGGYRLIYIAWGYTSIYFLFLICFNNNILSLLKDKTFQFLLTILIVFFIFTQLPSQTFFLRTSIRFLPFFSEAVTVASIYGISKNGLKITLKRGIVFILIIIISSLLTLFALEQGYKKIIVIESLFILFTLGYFYTICKQKSLKIESSIFYTILMFILMILSQRSLDTILAFPNVKKTINFENNLNKKGYILSLTNGGEGFYDKKYIEDLHSAQFLLYNLKSINGYSPLGNKEIQKNLEISLPNGTFNQEKTINNLSKKYREVCYFDLMNINFIVTYKDFLNEFTKSEIENCGYISKNSINPRTIYFIKNKDIIGNISYVSENIKVDILKERNNKEDYKISSLQEGEIIFSKPFYEGYTAKINNKKIEVFNYEGLIKLKIPKGLQNQKLELSYFPKSWRVTLWINLVGICMILFSLFYYRKKGIFK